MGEPDAIDRVDDPLTVDRLVSDLRALGITPGDTLLVHSSLESLGWVSGGPQAVVDALRATVTESGTVVVPTHSGQYTNPDDWEHPPVPDHWVEQIRDSMPAFSPAVTPTRGMGAVPECFRTYPDAVRSRHPTVSFAAWGAEAQAITDEHSYDDALGEHSPLGRLYERDASVLLLGVGYDVNTSLHLAEYRADVDHERIRNVAPVLDEEGQRTTVQYEDIDWDTDDFEALGAAYEAARDVVVGRVGAAETRLLDQRDLVDFAVEWFEAHRP